MADDSITSSGDELLKPEEIEALLGASAQAQDPDPIAQAPLPKAGQSNATASFAQGDVELLLAQAEAALASVEADQSPTPPDMKNFALKDFSGSPASEEVATLDLVRDVELNVKIELGRTHMHLEEVLKLRKGSVVPLDKLAGDPVDVYVNDRLVARGEVLVLNDNFCVRIADLIAGEKSVA